MSLVPAADSRPTGLPWQVKFVLLAVIWGSSFLLMKVGLETLQPVQIAAIRILSGAVSLVVILYASGKRLPSRWRDWADLAVMSFFLAVLPFTLFALAETRISSALAGIGNATTPVATVLAMLLLVPAHRARRAQVLAIIAGFLGVVTIMQPWAGTGRPDLAGFLMAVAAGSSYGVGWAYAARCKMSERVTGIAQPAATLVSATVLMVPFLLLWSLGTGGPASLMVVSAPPSGTPAWLPVAAVLLLGVVGTGFAYLLFFDVVDQAGAVIGSTVTYLIPVVSVLLGVLVLGERVGPWQLLGFAIVLAAAWIINRPPKLRSNQ